MTDLLLTSWELYALKNSLLIASAVSVCSVVLACACSVYLTHPAVWGRRILLVLLLIPLLIPPYLQTFAWMHFLWFSQQTYGVGHAGMELAAYLQTMPGVIFVLTISYFPIAFFILYQAMRAIPQDLVDAAALCARPGAVLRRIIIPSLLPSIVTGMLLTFIVAFITFDVPALLDTDVLVMHIFKLFSFQHETGRALYLSSIPLALSSILWSLLFMLTKKKSFFVPHPAVPFAYPIHTRPSTGTTLAFWTFISILLAFSFFPVLFLPASISIHEMNPYGAGGVLPVVFDTFRLALLASVMIVLFSIVVYRMMYRFPVGRIALLSLLIVPSVTFAIIFIRIFNTPFLNILYTTPIILVLAYCLRTAPVVCEILYAHATQLHPELIESARIVHPLSWRMISAILYPLYKPPLFLAWAFAYWFVITELPMTLLLQPAGFQTIASRLYILLHLGAEEVVSILTYATLIVSIVCILAVRRLFGVDTVYDAYTNHQR